MLDDTVALNRSNNLYTMFNTTGKTATADCHSMLLGKPDDLASKCIEEDQIDDMFLLSKTQSSFMPTKPADQHSSDDNGDQ